VAEHTNSLTGNAYTLQRFRLHKGRRLEPGEVSNSGAYAIMDSRRDYTLRIALDHQIAQLLCDWNWRYLQEVYIS